MTEANFLFPGPVCVNDDVYSGNGPRIRSQQNRMAVPLTIADLHLRLADHVYFNTLDAKEQEEYGGMRRQKKFEAGADEIKNHHHLIYGPKEDIGELNVLTTWPR